MLRKVFQHSLDQLLRTPTPELSREVVTASAGAAVAELVPGATTVIVLTDEDDEGSTPGIPDRRSSETSVRLALRHGDRAVGTMTVLVSDPALDAPVYEGLQTIADLITTCLLNIEEYVRTRTALEQTREFALHDPLTGLPNRTLLLDRLGQALSRRRRSGRAVGLLFADLDRFKWVNDLHGHAVGDELLAAFGSRLKSVLRDSDTAARLSGDEFVVVCEDLGDESDIASVATSIQTALSAPFELSIGTVSVTASIGIAVADEDERTADDLLHEADTAMYQAKRKGRGTHQVLDTREHSANRHRVLLEHQLKHAADRGELQLQYQPIVETVTGRPVGIEALLRWQHPDEGRLAPSVFLPMAKQTGLMSGLDQWVLRTAMAARTDLESRGRLASIDLSVNVSAQQLLAPDFVPTVAAAVRGVRTAPSSLVLEITEDVFGVDSDRALLILEDIKSLGVTVAIDNFGSRDFHLMYLARIPADVLKIDRTLIATLGHDPTSHAIVYAVAELAHLLGMIVVAEGVETIEQHHAVTVLGCDRSQGHYFSPPRLLDDLLPFLSSHETVDPFDRTQAQEIGDRVEIVGPGAPDGLPSPQSQSRRRKDT